MRIPQSAERLKEAPAQVLRAVLSKAASAREVPAPQALRGVLSKEAPAQALRAVFSSVGQVLLVTEKVRRRAMGGDQESPAPVASAAPTATAAAPAAATAAPAAVQTAERQAAAKPGTAAAAKPATGQTTPDKPRTSKASTTKASTTKASTTKASTAKASSTAKVSTTESGTARTSAADTSSTKPSAAKTDAAASPSPGPVGAPPIPHYSELSVASLRARMRGLDAGQLRELVSYERAHEDRETVIAMFERRIAKLQQEGPAATG